MVGNILHFFKNQVFLVQINIIYLVLKVYRTFRKIVFLSDLNERNRLLDKLMIRIKHEVVHSSRFTVLKRKIKPTS